MFSCPSDFLDFALIDIIVLAVYIFSIATVCLFGVGLNTENGLKLVDCLLDQVYYFVCWIDNVHQDNYR